MSGMSINAFLDKSKQLDCSHLLLQTQLSSTREEVIQNIRKGDILNLGLMSMRGPCVALFKGEVAGVVINKHILQLIKCMNNGHQFIAIVRDIEGGRCAITVKSSNANS